MTNEMSGLKSELMRFANQGREETFEDRISNTQHKIADSLKNNIPVNDSYGNSLLGIGTEDKVESFTKYGFSNDSLNWTLWLALYNDSWVFRRAIDKPSQDMIRCGITIIGDDVDIGYTMLNQHRFDFIQLLQWGRLFGGSVAVLMFDNFEDDDYSHPMNVDQLRNSKILKMYITDRWYGLTPSNDDLVEDMSNIDFGKPKFYNVTFADGKTIKIHHDFILRYEGRTAPKLVKNGMLQGWGYAEGSHIINELSRDDKLKSSIMSLIDKSLIEVIKMSGMKGLFLGADGENEEQLRKRLEMVNWARGFNSLTFLDSNDDYSMNTFSGLNGLSDLLEKNMWLVSAALDMQGVLYGDLKQGFSNDTEALERYDETINNLCESYLRPVYEKFLGIVYKWKGIQQKVDFTFNSLLMKKHDDERMDGYSKFIQMCSQLMQDGVIDLKQYAKAFRSFSQKGIIDFDLTDENIDKLDDKLEEEMENINI